MKRIDCWRRWPLAIGSAFGMTSAAAAGAYLPRLVTAVGAGEAPRKVSGEPALPASEPAPLRFRLSFDPAVQSGAYTGRVLVILSAAESGEPRDEINNWFRPPQVFARDLTRHDPREAAEVGEGSLGFPKKLGELLPGEYRVQTVARKSLDHPVPGQGAGDLYSDAVTVALDPTTSGPVELRLDRVVAERAFEESGGVKLVEIISPSLSRFHGREVKIRAGVVLPDEWRDDGETKFPVLYMIPGFGGNHEMVRAVARSRASDSLGRKVLFVVPDPTCYRGHSVFADSENNGPWGKALVEELIPHVERTFHGAQSGKHRYVAGVSSGGWSALWLQVAYADEFNGCWSHCPDPVDFRDFQRIDLYAEGSSLFRDAGGERRPLARRNDNVILWYEDFVQREEVLGPGGQIRSFEAVFSRRGADGRPESFFDAATGKVDTGVTKKWERFDLRLLIERNWSMLAPKLAGKLHVFAGEKDTFYLEGAVARLKESLAKLGSDAEVVVVPGMAHGLHREAVEPMYRTILENFARR